MNKYEDNDIDVDIFVIGGGINGCGIARDAIGRGLSVELAEMNDLASATSSASTKLFHGGLRYLEYWKVRLVREALIEREILLKAMPHISWPMRFVLPYHKNMRFDVNTPTSKLLNIFMPWLKGRRPAWLIRFGLFLYDNLGGRKFLKGTSSLHLSNNKEGVPLKNKYLKAFEYSDCWIEDSRLVVLNARDAEIRGAKINVRTKVVSAEQIKGIWHLTLHSIIDDAKRVVKAKMIVNAGGPWVEDIIQNKVRLNSSEGVRLVRGSHLITKKLYEHNKCYFFQGEDGRIIFTIPYETDFTLIGTTDVEHFDISIKPECTLEEKKYLVNFASEYFETKVTIDDIVKTYSGVRPLYNDNASSASSASAATRDYVLSIDETLGAPILNVFGGKITTYRKLSENALDKISKILPKVGASWTAGVPLPGGDFNIEDLESLINKLSKKYNFLDQKWSSRLIKAYGTDAFELLGHCENSKDLGISFGATLTEKEVIWLIENEYAKTADDIIWRRSKLGLRLSDQEIVILSNWINDNLTTLR